MKQIVLASNNPAKVREITEMLTGLDLEIVPQSRLGAPDVAETGLSFVENAILKARSTAQFTGQATIADDSGLEVDALSGEPGIYSARYAGLGASDRQNLDRLLERMKGLPDARRTARFQCLMVYLEHWRDPTPLICQGTWHGRILRQPCGHNGFGYDPVFYVPSHDCSAAELAPELKNTLSHRGQALRQLVQRLSTT
ncbi:MAG: RdgB/HAM1 family non-canonical purine NTP pyrophosphatase [Gammaproteobacteria bacterium]